MARLPLSQTVDASQFERSWRSSALALLTSTVVQALVIITLIVAPLLVAQAMPEPISHLSMPDFVIAHVDIPREPTPSAPPESRPPIGGHKPRVNADVFAPPTAIPDAIPEDDPYFSRGDPTGVPFGLPPGLGGQPLPPDPEPEPAAKPEPIFIVGDIQPPRKLVDVNPAYPPLARKAQVQGTVKLQAVIDAEGRVSNLVVLHSIALLDRAAIEAVHQWRYEPTFLNGRAVPVILTVEVEFVLHR